MLPLETQRLRDQYLTELRNDQQYNLSSSYRFALYQSFGLSRLTIHHEDLYKGKSTPGKLLKEQIRHFTVADSAIGWLAILTVQYILPKWQRAWTQYRFNPAFLTTPQQILEISKSLLTSKTVVEDELDDFYDQVATAANVSTWATYDVACSYLAAYYAFVAIVHGVSKLEGNQSYDTYDNTVRGSNYDFASEAVKAHTAIDENIPGDVIRIPIKFDINKRFEFWNWWLTEAIPEAWELAQNNYNAP